jgi:putative cell wall-binding protein
MSVWGRVAVLGLALVTACSALIVAQPTPAAQAVSGSDFDPGYIISDDLFYDSAAMSVPEIQSFLDSKIGTCLTDRCLNVAVLPVSTRAAYYSSGDVVCSEIAGGTLSVAELLYRTQVACGISAKVILVTMQKEQSLVTSRAPSDWALRSAMGMGCPDTAPCDDAFAGLANQIMSGARQMKVYKVAGFARQPGVHYIGYSPDSTCGGTDVDIRNYATAALYNYTPYQPNAAALANLGGVGDGCSSYGNRNFWAYYNNWFGSTISQVPAGVTVSRINGLNRFEVSAQISKGYFAPGVAAAYVVSGLDFADGVSAGAAAAHDGGPVLLIEQNSIPSAIAAELTRLQPQRIVIVGGEGVITASVAAALGRWSADVQRVAGPDRYATSRAVAEYAFAGGVTSTFLATGRSFPDALSASAAAGVGGSPVILVDGSQGELDSATQATLDGLGVQQVHLAGGTGVVSAGIESALVTKLGAGNVDRLSGANRYLTSAAINSASFVTASTFYLASGEDFADALSATPVAALSGAPLYVTDPKCVSSRFVQHLVDAGGTKVVIVGGPAAVTQDAASFRRC